MKFQHALARLDILQKHLPSNVQRFEQLMYLSIGLSLIEMPLDWKELAATTNPFAVVLLSFAVGVLLVWQTAREHKNWARWVLLVLGVGSLASSFQSLGPVAGTLRLGELLAWGAAMFFIFTGNAQGWFQKCANCGAARYAGRSPFCTRCGSAFVAPPRQRYGRRYYNAASPSAWSSIPFLVRLAIYIVCIPIVIGGLFWALLFLSIAVGPKT